MDVQKRVNYLMFGKYEPSRWDRFKRRLPRIRVSTRRGDEDGPRIWNARRSWVNGTTAQASGIKLWWTLRHSILQRRPNGSVAWYPVMGGDITPSGAPIHTHTFDAAGISEAEREAWRQRWKDVSSESHPPEKPHG